MFSSDVIVIGGGLVGTAVAYGLSQLGKNITVLDEGDDVFRASRENFGLIWVHGKGRGVPHYARWTRESARQWPTLAAQLHEQTGIDVQAKQPGAFFLCFSEAELEARGERLAGAMVEHTIAAIARGLVGLGVRQLVVAGGETSGACVQALGIAQMQIGPQIDPGVPWCHAPAQAAGAGLHIALKSGNFGTDDFFSKAFSFIG